jgi:tetratricopeptide (TPR) repeat protein
VRVHAEQHPEILLVDGECALALGDPTGALAQGRRYLERAPRAGAAGHALVGEALAARGNLAEARRELEAARADEPKRRRWTVRLAAVLRRGGHAADAVAALDALGPPDRPATDPEWWAELGEALLGQGLATAVVAKLTPVVGELPGDVAVHTALAAGELAVGQAEAAVKTLDADAIVATPRGKQLLVDALTAVAADKLVAADAAGALPLLERADQLDGNATVWRDLGIARLATGQSAGAVTALDRAARADASSVVAALDARAHAAAGDLEGARALYQRALAADKDGVEVAIDWAASELAGGDPAVAVAALEKTAGAAKAGPLAQRHKVALGQARHATALAALRAGNAGKAMELLRDAVAVSPTVEARCDLALATVTAGDAKAAIAALHALNGVVCPYPPPADTQAVPILLALTDGLDPKRAARALDRLTALGGKATGAAAALLGTAIRVVALSAAQDAYRGGQLAATRSYLATAKAASARAGADEVTHDLAVLDLADGKIDAAIAQLEKLVPRVPEALVNLGIAYERKGDHARALDAWRRARKANVRFPALTDWIDAKERIHGEGAP